jgi:hypothetical protein
MPMISNPKPLKAPKTCSEAETTMIMKKNPKTGLFEALYKIKATPKGKYVTIKYRNNKPYSVSVKTRDIFRDRTRDEIRSFLFSKYGVAYYRIFIPKAERTVNGRLVPASKTCMNIYP